MSSPGDSRPLVHDVGHLHRQLERSVDHVVGEHRGTIGRRHRQHARRAVVDLLARVGGDAEHLADDRDGKDQRELVDDVDPPALPRVGEQLAADGADGVLLRGDRHRGEHPRHEAAVPRVLGLVLVDEDVVAGVETFDGHAVPGQEGGGVEAGGEHVVVARQRPEAHLLVVVHGRFVAHPAVHRERVVLDRRRIRVVLHRSRSRLDAVVAVLCIHYERRAARRRPDPGERSWRHVRWKVCGSSRWRSSPSRPRPVRSWPTGVPTS